MTHDFKGALNDDMFQDDIGIWADRHKEAIQTALLIADRLQSGDVSEEMFRLGVNLHNSTPSVFSKKMSEQLIKECSD